LVVYLPVSRAAAHAEERMSEAAFVLKPLSPPVLVRRVREVLDE
jgi:hypothetical protein